MTENNLPVVGWIVGRNGDWRITDIRFTGIENYRIMIDGVGMKNHIISRAGIGVNPEVFFRRVIEFLEKEGYTVTKNGE